MSAPGAARALEMIAQARPGAAKALEMSARAWPGDVRALEMASGPGGGALDMSQSPESRKRILSEFWISLAVFCFFFLVWSRPIRGYRSPWVFGTSLGGSVRPRTSFNGAYDFFIRFGLGAAGAELV